MVGYIPYWSAPAVYWGLLSATRLACRKILIKQNIKKRTGAALWLLCGPVTNVCVQHQNLQYVHTVHTEQNKAVFHYDYTLYVYPARSIYGNYSILISSKDLRRYMYFLKISRLFLCYYFTRVELLRAISRKPLTSVNLCRCKYFQFCRSVALLVLRA